MALLRKNTISQIRAKIVAEITVVIISGLITTGIAYYFGSFLNRMHNPKINASTKKMMVKNTMLKKIVDELNE
jgi:hypothetical protein